MPRRAGRPNLHWFARLIPDIAARWLEQLQQDVEGLEDASLAHQLAALRSEVALLADRLDSLQRARLSVRDAEEQQAPFSPSAWALRASLEDISANLSGLEARDAIGPALLATVAELAERIEGLEQQPNLLGRLSADVAGFVRGPDNSTDNALTRWDGVDGRLVQNSPVTVDDSGNMAGVGTFTGSGNVTINTNAFVVDATNKRAGIGTSPTYALDVQGLAAATYAARFRQGRSLMLTNLENTTAASTGNSAGFEFRLSTSTSTRTAARQLASFYDTTDASRSSKYAFFTSLSGAFGENFTMYGDAFGIGYTTPANRLAVAGGASIGTNSAAPSNGLLVSGDVDFDGAVSFGTHTAIGAEALSGYIEITDSGGTTRKLAVVS